MKKILNLIRTDKYQRNFFLLISFLVFYFAVIKPQLLGLIPGHHGWVSSEQLAMIGRSTMENGFFGYRFLIDGNPDYFSKMPFTFMALFNGLISITDNISVSLNIARYIMDVTLLLIMALSYNILYLITDNWRGSLLGVIFGGCGSLIVYYNDLISPDIFLALSFLISAHAIYFINNKQYKIGFFLVFISVNVGFVLLNALPYFLWMIILFVKLVLKKIEFKIFLRSSIISLFAAMFTVSLFVYGMYQEAEIKDVSIKQTNVYHSFSKRSGGYSQGYYNKYLKGRIEFENYMPNSINYFVNSVFTPASKSIFKIQIINFLFFLLLLFYIIQPSEKKITLKNIDILAILSLSSLYTFVALKGYVIIHDFGKIPLIIFSMIVWSLVFFKLDKKYFVIPFILGLYIFYTSYNSAHINKLNKLKKQNIEITDFDNINQYLKGKTINLYINGGYSDVYRGAPYSLGFFISQQNIVSKEDNSDYVLSKSKNKHTLTPNNKTLFLYEKDYLNKSRLENIRNLTTKTKLFSSKFDIYKIDNKLILYREKCIKQDIKDIFFLHIAPNNVKDIPAYRQKYKFDNLDFKAPAESFYKNSCYIEKKLPSYKYNAITIGQFNKSGQLWTHKIGETK